jgi:3-oxoacyl-[acyl-carrier protein] reductase
MTAGMTINYNFKQKKIVVTGGARGIGLEIAKQFLSAGGTVAIWDYSPETLAAAKKELAAFAERVILSQVDISQAESCEQAAQALPFAVDVLVNNAGITRDKTLAKMTSDDFSVVIQTNLTGVFNVTKSLLGKFAAEGPKRIISISSVVALYGNFGQANYVAAKAGVIGMTKTWARELARKGFTANAIAPGFTLTPMVQAMPEEARKAMEAKIPVARLGLPADIAHACLFLASDEAGYVNGAVLSVDGGLVC